MARSEGSRRVTIIVLIVIMVAALGVAGFSIVDANIRTAEDRESQSILNQMQSEVYDLMIIAQEAAAGDENALFILPDLKNQIRGLMSQFNATEDEIAEESRATLNNQISIIAENIDTIEAQTENVLFLYDQLSILEASIPQIQQAYTTVVDTMLQAESPPDQVAEAQAQVWRAERLLTSLNRILGGSDDAVASAEQFRQDVLVFNQVLTGMREGNLIMGITRVESPEARLLLEQVDNQFAELNQSIESVISASPSLGQISQSSSVILDTAAALLQSTTAISDEISALADNIQKRPLSTAFTTLVAASVVVLVLFILGVQIYFNTRKNLVSTEDTNERNQEAILRLLDEIADLGEGDLTVHATVTEDFTGAIADSINYAIEQLRGLVARVATTAESVAASSNETRATSLRLSEASEHQATQIANASSSINEISENLSKVSENAEQLANTAQRSVTVARNGASVVQNTIEGMNNIREQIQDTSKRIKRLGESSQEIGDIVSLINEIADQTNILALNASIQAAMAGEAGRGFAVVADEVQGLAERAAASTRQIENLVKTIQSDTNEAVASMEQTTAEVVRGAQLANNAGNALNDIQTTSENLATLILAIAKETQNQSKSAESIVGSMRVIQDISAQTLEGTTESARAVGELSEQADELRQSIADFKLPDAMQPESIVNSVDDDLPAGVDEMSFVDVEEDSESSNSGILDDEMILGEEDDETTSFEADSHESSDDDADLDVDFIDDFDTGTDDTELAANADIETADESLDEVDFTEFDDERDETEATVSLDVGSEAEAADSDVSSGENETAEADDFEATMIMEAPDLQSEEETDDSEKPEEKKTDKDPEQDDEDEMDFSFDDEDFLSFDIDEEEKK
jgi:twitching motility protein PilJ